MSDLLIKLYNLPDFESNIVISVSKSVIRLRHAMAYEKQKVVKWVHQYFGDGWASECDVAFSSHPISCHIATQNGGILGFACYDSTSRGMLGPIGVIESARGKGIGRGLLLSCLYSMAAAGYAYAVIGGAGSVDFYQRVVNVIEIPDSVPGIYVDRLSE